ncbi:MAG: hypothetical protein HQ561_08805 [Desulfobacteraceae bacterium]|nr:hypothetical protein [Desulfobacteraceae bacterium]
MHIKGPVTEEELLIPFGMADLKREGSDVTLVTYSLMVHKALAAAEELEKQDIHVEVIDLRTLNPWDKKTVLDSVEKTGRLLIVHQATTTSGFGAEIAATLAREGFEFLIGPIRRLGGLDVPVPFSPELENFVIPNEQKIVKEVISMVEA